MIAFEIAMYQRFFESDCPDLLRHHVSRARFEGGRKERDDRETTERQEKDRLRALSQGYLPGGSPDHCSDTEIETGTFGESILRLWHADTVGLRPRSGEI